MIGRETAYNIHDASYLAAENKQLRIELNNERMRNASLKENLQEALATLSLRRKIIHMPPTFKQPEKSTS